MKVKLNQELKGIDGITNLINPSTKKVMTLRDACINSLCRPVEADNEKVKLEKYCLYKSIRDASSEIELEIEDVAFLKKMIGISQPQLIMGQCFEMIEGEIKKVKR